MGSYGEPTTVIERLLHEHTLLPHSMLLYSEATRRAILRQLSNDSSHHAESAAEQVQVPFGTRKLVFGLKYCPECAEEDHRAVGESWWHVEHQGQGTALCLRHECWLWVTPVIRRRLVTGPQAVPAADRRPMGYGKPRPVVRSVAQVEQQLRSVRWHPDLARNLRRALISALRRRGGKRYPSEIGYADGWREFGADDWRNSRTELWDAGLACVAALGPHRLTRDIWGLTRYDRPIACYLGQIVRLEVDVSALQSLRSSDGDDGVETASPEARLFKDMEICGSRFCQKYNSEYAAILTARNEEFMEQIDGSCNSCGWRGTARATGVFVRDFGVAFKREALRLASETELRHEQQAHELGVSPGWLGKLWRRWQRAGEEVDGRRFTARVRYEWRAAMVVTASATRRTRVKAKSAWKLRPGLQFLDPQYDAQAVHWSGPNINRYERILESSKVLTASEAASALRCGKKGALRRVISGQMLALRRGRNLLLPASQFDRRLARIRPEYARLFSSTVNARVNAWDLAEQLVQPVAADPLGRSLHELVLDGEHDLVAHAFETMKGDRESSAEQRRAHVARD